MRRELLTPIPPHELEELTKRVRAEVKLTLLGKGGRDGIALNRVLIEGPEEDVGCFIEKLRLARAGG